jgi:hypothetical protein
MVLALRDENVCRQLNALILYVSLEVLEILLEIEINLLDAILILLLCPLDLYVSYLGPLIIELLFQEFTRLHVEHDDFIRRELKSCINPL